MSERADFSRKSRRSPTLACLYIDLIITIPRVCLLAEILSSWYLLVEFFIFVAAIIAVLYEKNTHDYKYGSLFIALLFSLFDILYGVVILSYIHRNRYDAKVAEMDYILTMLFIIFKFYSVLMFRNYMSELGKRLPAGTPVPKVYFQTADLPTNLEYGQAQSVYFIQYPISTPPHPSHYEFSSNLTQHPQYSTQSPHNTTHPPSPPPEYSRIANQLI